MKVFLEIPILHQSILAEIHASLHTLNAEPFMGYEPQTLFLATLKGRRVLNLDGTRTWHVEATLKPTAEIVLPEGVSPQHVYHSRDWAFLVGAKEVLS